MSVAEQATKQSGHPLNLFDLEPAIPDANTLLSLKLLKEADPATFGGLAAESVKWLTASIKLLESDDFLKIKFGGSNVNAAMQLAPILKQRVEEKHIQARIDQVATPMLQMTYDADLGIFRNGAALKPIGTVADFPSGAGTWQASTLTAAQLMAKRNANNKPPHVPYGLVWRTRPTQIGEALHI